MQIKPKPDGMPIFGVTGHVGAGHVHSHKGFIQDDSGGFAAATSLIKVAYPADTSIHRVTCTRDTVEVETVDGGIGKATARRGFTTYEEELLQRSLGLDGRYSQSIAYRCFGRIYGQGVMEAPVAFQTALSLAVIDTFHKKYPEEILICEEGLESNVGMCMGTLVDINGLCIAVMALINATAGGIGPVEDLEGNVCLAEKGLLMNKLRLAEIPTLIIESKAYIPTLSSQLSQNKFLVRYNEEFDNPAVGKALIEAIEKCDIPYLSSSTAYPRYTGEMKETTIALGRRIAALGKKIEISTSSSAKASLIAELALVVSQDAGGITYMTNDLHEIVSAGGLVPGMAAVLSIAVSEAYMEEHQIPEISPEDIDSYLKIIVEVVGIIPSHQQEMNKYLKRREKFDTGKLNELVIS
jgi:hypothetical protein